MRDNTPDPMGDPNAYYKDYDAVPEGETFAYPDSAYGVMAWWDYGYWITRVAHRMPNTNPSQSYDPIVRVANFFLSQDLTAAESIRELLGSRYIISDYEVSTSKLHAILQWAGLDSEKYLPQYYISQNNQLYEVPVYSLDYYRTLIVRMYNFDGKAVAEGKPTVITYEMVTTTSGTQVRLITDSKDFNSYQDAVTYIASQDSTKSYAIIGSDPLVSPIALEALSNYTEIYTSAVSTNATQPVKIFEYTGAN
jgi:dolichyl-diphosphooligosaccharide--protein glycosyltransferase